MSKHLYKNWYVLEESNCSQVSYLGNTCFMLNSPYANSVALPNYFYTDFVYPNQIGNSVTVNSASWYSEAELAIFDGVHSVVAKIGTYVQNEGTYITIGTNTFSFDTLSFHNYTLSLQNGTYKFYIEDELLFSGTADLSSEDPTIYYGFKTNPSSANILYVSYLKSGRAVEETYRVGNWYLNDIRGYSVVTYDGVTCAELDAVMGANNVLNDYFYTYDVGTPEIGNSVCANIAFNPETIMLVDSNNYMYASEDDVFFTASNKAVAQLCIADGEYMVVANIGNGQVVIGNNEYTLSTTHFHNYWLTLKDGKYQMFVDNDLILEGDAISAEARLVAFGFMDLPSAGDSVYIKYLKNIKEYRRPLNLSKMAFELQVDTTDTFDSANLESYYDIDNSVYSDKYNTIVSIDSDIQFIINPEETVSPEVEATLELDGVSGAPVLFTIPTNLPETVKTYTISKEEIAKTFFIQGIPSGWVGFRKRNVIYLKKDRNLPVNNKISFTISGVAEEDIEKCTPKYTIDYAPQGTALGNGIVRSFTIPLLPRQDMKNICYFFRARVNSEYYISDWAYYHFDEPAIDILFTKKDTMKQVQYKVDKMVAFCYEGRQSYMLIENPGPSDFREGYVQIKDSPAIWKPISSSYFLLDPNMSSYYFDSIYNYRMPDEEVYTKYDKSGNIANAIDSETVLLDMTAFEIKNSSRDLDVHLCRDNYLYNNFGKQYSLASEYFNTINEFRNTLLTIINNYCEPGNTYKLQEILATITGVMPEIEEFKHKKKWVIWDSTTSLIKPDNEKYILFNSELPYSNKNKAVLQTAEGKAFTFNIHLYNPLGLKINKDLINVIVESFKPVFSQANIIFYTQDGMPYTYPAEYYFSNYGQGLYYREDTQENN